MERSKAYIIIVDYIENRILPGLESDVTRCIAGGCLVIVPKVLDMLVDKYEDVRRLFDILDDNGGFHVKGIEKWLTSAFKAQPELVIQVDKILGTLFPTCPPGLLDCAKVKIKFRKADAEELVASLSRA